MSKQKSKKSEEGRPADVRSYRFDNRLWDQFEERCALHLYNPRAVIEAVVLEWLASDESRHKELAKKYRDWQIKQS